MTMSYAPASNLVLARVELDTDGNGRLNVAGSVEYIQEAGLNAARVRAMSRVRDIAHETGQRVVLEAHGAGDVARLLFTPDGTVTDAADVPPDTAPDPTSPDVVPPTPQPASIASERTAPVQPASTPSWSLSATTDWDAPGPPQHTTPPPMPSQEQALAPQHAASAESMPQPSSPAPCAQQLDAPTEPTSIPAAMSSVDGTAAPRVKPVETAAGAAASPVPVPEQRLSDLAARPKASSPPMTEGELLEQTILMPRKPTTPKQRGVWMSFATGETSFLTGSGVLGRRPSGAGDEQMVTVRDRTMSMSRSHLRFGFIGTDLWILDLGSANGTTITVDSVENTCIPGRRYFVEAGDVVTIGDVRTTLSSGAR